MMSFLCAQALAPHTLAKPCAAVVAKTNLFAILQAHCAHSPTACSHAHCGLQCKAVAELALLHLHCARWSLHYTNAATELSRGWLEWDLRLLNPRASTRLRLAVLLGGPDAALAIHFTRKLLSPRKLCLCNCQAPKRATVDGNY